MKNKHFRRLYFIIPAVFVIAAGIVFGLIRPHKEAGAPGEAEDIIGCYVYDECLYMNPLSSFMPFGGMPYVYGVGRDTLLIADTATGDIQSLSAQYEKTPVPADAFSSESDIVAFRPPDLSHYKERWLRAVFDGAGRHYNLYQLDGDIWLVDRHGDILWSIYKLQRTDGTTLDDLKRALAVQDNAKGLPQMTLKDVYALARKGDSLTLGDFDRFDGSAVGSGLMITRYDIEGGCVLLVHCDAPDSEPNYIRLSKRGYDPYDEALTVDIREGADAVAAYLDPLHALASLKIEDPHSGSLPLEVRGDSDVSRALIYEFDGYRYYLKTTRADSVFITFDNGERMPLRQALAERRTIIEDVVANGLSNVFMEPSDNPLGGSFTILHHAHTFSFDGERFYPSKSFMYIGVDYTNIVEPYFDAAELADILEFQGRDEFAGKLRQIIKTNARTVINEKSYITFDSLVEVGISVDIGWELSSHTPVDFSS